MIFELSKDKSLLSLLSKVDLDKNTESLVKSNANVYEIKKSLEDNINSTNIVEYRKYIIKAEEEISEEEEEQQRIADEALSEIEDFTESGDIVDESSDKERKLRAAAHSQTVRQEDAEDKAFKFLSSLEVIVEGLEKIGKTARVTKKGNKKEVTNAMKAYLELGSSITNSSKVLDVLALLKKDPNYIKSAFGRFLSDGMLTGKTRQTGKTKRTRKDINVNELIGKVNSVLNLRFDVGETDEEIDIIDVFTLLHVQRHKREPPNIKDRKRLKREYQGIQLYLKGQSPKAARDFKNAKKKLSKLRDNTDLILRRKIRVDEKIEELEEILTDTDKIVENKLKRLNEALRTVMTDKKSKLSPDKITSMTRRIQELRDNPDKYLEEARDEIQEDLETERVKLEKYSADLNAVERVKEVSKRFNKILGMFRDNEPVDVIKRNLTKGMNIITKLNFRARGIEIMSAKLGDKIEDGLAAYLEDNPEVKLTLEADGLSFDGAPTIDANALVRMDELTDKFNELVQKLEEVTNILENDIQGKKPTQEGEE